MNIHDADSFIRAYTDALRFLVGSRPDEQARLLAWVEKELEQLPQGFEGFQRTVAINPHPHIEPEDRARRAALRQLRGQLQTHFTGEP